MQWLLNRVELAGDEAIAAYRAPAARTTAASADLASFETPPMFSMSLQGRIGRLRALAWSVPAVMPFAAIGVAAALLMQKHSGLAVILAITGLVLMCWFGLRLMVLRLHDVNLSGKWILLFLLMSGVAERDPESETDGRRVRPVLAIHTRHLLSGAWYRWRQQLRAAAGTEHPAGEGRRRRVPAVPGVRHLRQHQGRQRTAGAHSAGRQRAVVRTRRPDAGHVPRAGRQLRG
ncbi:DUF805 domain-containing protein [Massilia sp. B-10]|nr:DUF805 domain-containing protein [Massilia sp. B-10]